MKIATRMSGIGSAFPPRRMTNAEIAKLVDTNDEWVQERTGIMERRISDFKNPDEQNSSLGKAAALKALEMAGKTPADIDGILYATCTPDTLIPSTACWLQLKLGAKRAWALDINAACSGFVFGVNLGRAMIESGQAKTILVCGVDTVSAFVDWTDRGTCILFGDGAGAAVLEATPASNESRILGSRLGSDGALWEMIHIPAGGSNMEITAEVHQQKLDKIKMKGKEIFKVAVKTLADYAETTLRDAGFTTQDVNWLVPHQANLRIIEAVANRLDFPIEKVLINIGEYGNTSSATAPTAFDQAVRDGRVKKGDLILFDVFGAGLTYGSVLLRW